MPIKIPDNLPARDILLKEHVPVMDESTAIRQDIRPLRILLLNLMPDKITTETQIARVLGATPLQIELTLLRTATYMGKNTAEDHLLGFYQTFDQVKDQYFDGFIVTGAPVEQMAFESVAYWNELTGIFDWSSRHAFSSLFICWAAQAAVYHFHGHQKFPTDSKRFGVYPHRRLNYTHALTRGFDDVVNVPVSRHTEVRDDDILGNPRLTVLLQSVDTGVALVADDAARRVFMFNHLEYDLETLKNEYERDVKAGLDTALPAHYFPDNDPAKTPLMTWRSHRNLLFSNWINIVYQGTPYRLETLGAS